MPHLGRILFVEDHPDVREAFTALLQEYGYQVDAVDSAEAGLEHLGTHGADLLVTDYSLPGNSGAWLIREADRRGLARPDQALVVTAIPHPEGCEGITVLRKPLDLNVFLERLAGQLANKVAAVAQSEAEHRPGRWSSTWR